MIVLAAAPVPIFIACATASLPILIGAPEELIPNAPTALISTPPAAAVKAIASAPVPCVFVTTIVSDAPPGVPAGVVKEIAEAKPVLSALALETKATCPPEIFTSFP